MYFTATIIFFFLRIECLFSQIHWITVFNRPGVVKISLRRRHALMIGDGAFSHKIDYVTIFKEILNPEGHPNCITGSRVTAIFLNGWILPISGASAVEGLQSTGLPRLVYQL